MLRQLLIVLLLTATPALAQSDVTCEAVTIWHEAGNQGDVGKRAVLDVIRHRAKVLRKSSCDVVKQHGQFSFVRKNFKWKLTQNILHDWQKADTMGAVLEGAWYFNSSKRIRKYKFYKRIGAHNFYYRK